MSNLRQDRTTEPRIRPATREDASSKTSRKAPREHERLMSSNGRNYDGWSHPERFSPIYGKAVIYYRRGPPKNPAESASTSDFFVCLESSRVATKASLYLDRARLRSCDEDRRGNDD